MSDFDERDSILRRATVKALIEKYRAKLGLSDWEIRYVHFADEGDQASTHYRLNEKAAQVGVDPDAPYELLETLVIHELVHLVLKPLTSQMENIIAKQKDETFRDYLADQFDDAEEEVVEQLSRALGGRRFLSYGDLLPRWEAYAS